MAALTVLLALLVLSYTVLTAKAGDAAISRFRVAMSACMVFALMIYPVRYFFYLLSPEGKIYRSVLKSLRSVCACDVRAVKTFLPDVRVDGGTVRIQIPDIATRAVLEQYAEQISSALPPDYIAVQTYLSEDESTFCIDVVQTGDKMRLYYRSPSEVMAFVKNHPYEFPLDMRTTIDIHEMPHLLITGKTGSGKSYYASFLAASAIARGWMVYILDFKRSYTMFRTSCTCAFDVDQIYWKLRGAVQLMHERQAIMENLTAEDINMLACEADMKPVIIVIEEYMALMNSGADKKILKEIEQMVLEITAVGRAMDVHVVLVMQVASAKDLNSSIRANCAAMVFGNANSTIYETAFGTKTVPNVTARFKPGQGLGMFEVEPFRFSAPTLLFPLRDLLTVSENKSADGSTRTG